MGNSSHARLNSILSLLKNEIDVCYFGLGSSNTNWDSIDFLFEIERFDDSLPFSKVVGSNKNALNQVDDERTKFLRRMDASVTM